MTGSAIGARRARGMGRRAIGFAVPAAKRRARAGGEGCAPDHSIRRATCAARARPIGAGAAQGRARMVARGLPGRRN